MRKTTLLLCLLWPLFSFSQKILLKGTVSDSLNNPLEMANVIAFKKGTKLLQSYSITDSRGQYKLSLEEQQDYTLKVSYLGYDTQTVELSTGLGNRELKRNITLRPTSEALKEVEITYEIPVKIVGDTIMYNADSFTSGKEKKLGDVLKKLPGVDIDDNGEVEVEGKKVQKVLVEGKAFFEGDSKLATQNIPASAIDKVQVLKNYNEVSGMRGVTNNEDNIAINIKLKQGQKRFWFGEVNAGGGDPEKYIAKPKLFYYSPEKSINLLADLNNIGEAPFTRKDYYRFTGGLRGAFMSSGTNYDLSSGGFGFLTTQNNKAQEIRSTFGALNFTLAPKKSFDVNGFAIVNNSETDIYTASSTVYHGMNLNEENSSQASQGYRLGLLKFSGKYKPHNDLQIDYDIFGKISEQTETNDVSSSNRGAVDTYKEEKPRSLNQQFNLYYTIDEQQIFSVEAQHLYQSEAPLYNSKSAAQPFAIIPSTSSSLYELLQDKNIQTHILDAKLDYFYLLTPKSHLNLSLGTTLSSQSLETTLSQTTGGGMLSFEEPVLNNDVHYDFSDLYLGAYYKMVSGIFTFHPGLILHRYGQKDQQQGSIEKQNKTMVLPKVYARLQFKSSESLRFNYAIKTQFSDIDKMAEGYVLRNYNLLTRGNRALEEALHHNYSLSYFSFSMFSFTNIIASLNYTKKVNSVKNRTQLIGLDQISYPVNVDLADETLSAFFRYGKTYSKLKTNFRARVSESVFHNIVNDQPVKARSLSHNYQASLATKFKDAPNIELGYQKSFSTYSNTGSTTDRPFANIEVGFLKDFILTADYSYYHYRNEEETLRNRYAFLNANLYYQQEDSPWEFKVSGTNLTDNTSINTDSYQQLSDSNTTTEYFVQPRLWLLSVKYTL
ncbi:MAG: carboxypeptidase-like regulatory domain-containing protein [Lutibacter sp.]|jgi:hypothetical protein|nr:carboxypeptidase-like regulatory domain-containing protein [Lutibacter sp.]